MTLPAAFLTALTQPGISVELWLELEGIPVAFGLKAREAAFFAGRTERYRRTSIAGNVLDVPSGVEAEARPLDGDSSIGNLSLTLEEDPGGVLLGLVTNTGRADGFIKFGATKVWAASTPFSLGDIVVPTTVSAAAGKDRMFYAVSVTGASGGSEPSWPADDFATISDGGITWREAGLQTMPASSAQGRIPSKATWSVGDLIYVGRETLSVAQALGTAGGTTLYRVDRAYHELDGQTNWHEHHQGDIITTYPRFVATRRAILYSTLDGTDTNKVARWAGTVRDVKADGSLSRFKIDLTSIGAEIKRTVFANQRRGKLKTGIADADGHYDADGTPSVTRLELEPSSLSGAAWPATATKSYFRCGDEIFCGEISATENGVIVFGAAGCARGLFSTSAEQHAPGDEVVELLIIAAQGATGPVEFRWTKFTSDHPIDVVLALLTSRKGDAANGSDDILPEGWGAGILAARVDAATTRAMRDRWLPYARHVEIIDEPFNCKSKIAEILRPFSCYPVTLLSDRMVIKRTNPPMPDDVPTVIDSGNLVAVPTWQADLIRVVGKVVFQCDRDIRDGSFRQRYIGEIQGPGTEAQEFYAGMYVTLEIEARGQYSGNDPNVTGPLGAAISTGAADVALSYVEMVKDRYARPGPALGVETRYELLPLERGDLVYLALPGIPSIEHGRRLLAGEQILCEVLGRTIDDARAKVTFTLRQFPSPGAYRLVAPSAIVDGIGNDGSPYFTLLTHEFSGTSSSPDESKFSAGDVVECWSPDLVTRRGGTTYTIASMTSSRIRLAGGANPTGLTAGDVLLLAPYASATAARKARNAFLADAAQPALVGSDPSHQYVG